MINLTHDTKILRNSNDLYQRNRLKPQKGPKSELGIPQVYGGQIGNFKCKIFNKISYSTQEYNLKKEIHSCNLSTNLRNMTKS